MSAILFLLQHGWKNLWKVKTVWLFSILYYINSFFALVLPRYNPESGGFLCLIYPIAGIFGIILFYIGSTGVIYSAYRATRGETFTLREAWRAVRKFVGRIIVYSILFGVVGAVPFLCLFIYYNNTSATYSTPSFFAVVPILLGIFGAMFYFPMIGIVANDWRVGESVKNAWRLFTGHFGILLLTGLSLAVIAQIAVIIIGMVAILFQSNFDIAALGKLNYLSPYFSLANNRLYLLANAVIQIILPTYNAFVFTLAYLNYSDISDVKEGDIIQVELSPEEP